MRFVIIGAGAVGGTLGARLHQSGHDVVLVARGAHGDALRSEGLTLHTAEGAVTLPVPTVSGPDELALTPDDVLVCAVKSQDTRDVLDTWAHVPVGPSGRPAAATLAFVVAQNGVANEVAALRLFARVYPVCVWLPATYLEPGVVHAEGFPYSGWLTVGRLGGPLDDVSARLVAALGASRFLAVEDAEVMRWKHGKLLSNLGNGLDAVCGRAPGTDELAARLRAEGRAALTAAGIAFSTPQEEAARRGDAVQVRPAPGTDRGGSSTWQSLARGTGSIEVDYLNGEIGLLGRLHGVATPVNDAVRLAAHRLLAEGRAPRSFDVAELTAMVADAEAARA
ncbi:ketopantoate reductase family protein [Cellulomonas aerilata]|uniref:2-dehydropantoate 2-reductase n=1 Tax=Cellulomonas aerilata TaxID=515326 RepID=A0A512DCS3_9CELL|nr:2-dehydropantoate 2-reductase N-terminal domain-containing protein [Cellulomonas aerilata]GEO34272.1 2-dehydropantoate 2-reductase [Cellulomonas aerilata]